MHGLHWRASWHLLRIFSSKPQQPTILVSCVSFWMHFESHPSNMPDRSYQRYNESDPWLNDTPCRAVFWTINAGANLLSVYWIPNRRLKGSLRDYLRMCRNCFDPVADISEQPKTAHWIEKISSFNMVCITSNTSERIAAESRPELLHWILNIILYWEFTCLRVDNWRTEHAYQITRADLSSA